MATHEPTITKKPIIEDFSEVIPPRASLYVFLTAMAREERSVRRDISRLSNGLTTSRPRKKLYEARDKHFLNLVRRHQDGLLTEDDFLRKVAKKIVL